VDGVVSRAVPALLVALALASGCGDPSANHGGPPPPPTVEVVTVDPKPFSDVVELVGQLESAESVVLRPEITGVIESIHFEEGQVVKTGDVLFRLKSERQRAALREAQAKRLLAADVFRRTQELARRQISAVAELDRARAELEAADAAVEIARVELERTEIKAPFDGAVGARQVSPGDRVNGDTSLVQVDMIDRLQLLFGLPETAVGLAREGIRVSVAVAPFPGEHFEGTVYFVAPALDPQTRRLALKAWVPNPGHRLRPGLFATLEAEVEHIEDALVIPESAIVYDAGGAYVWRVGADGLAARADVTLGPRREGNVVVREGVAPGDRIVTAGTHKVMPGAPLRVRAAGEPATAPPEAASAAQEGT
jgi:membrane fusion protein (multidrug efflux system)